MFEGGCWLISRFNFMRGLASLPNQAGNVDPYQMLQEQKLVMASRSLITIDN